MAYSPKVLDHYSNPRVGSFSQADRTSAPALRRRSECGAMLRNCRSSSIRKRATKTRSSRRLVARRDRLGALCHLCAATPAAWYNLS